MDQSTQIAYELYNDLLVELAKYGQNENGTYKLTIDTDNGTIKADDLPVGAVSVGSDYVIVTDLEDNVLKVVRLSDSNLVNVLVDVAIKLRKEHIDYDQPETGATDF